MKYKNVKYKDVKEWLKSQDTYTLHKPKKKKPQTEENNCTRAKKQNSN